MISVDDALMEIVYDYAPVLHFHPREGTHCCYPSDAEVIYELFAEDWSKFTEDRSPSDLDPDAPCYYELWNDPQMLQIRYWIWYRFNSFPGAPMGRGDHLGDWEHIEIRLYNEPREENITVWLLSNHLTARLVSRSRGISLPGFVPEAPTLTGNHVHSWVALGSHANYASSTSKPYCYAKVFCDKIADGGAIWETWERLKPLAETNFAGFTGRWGDSRAPRSPANEHNNRWRNTDDSAPFRL
ncbi:MAG: hypothetical protein ACW99U_03515 [Candidatus Thorarchaeota archaeon]|jgi:hypothetical protein